MLIPSIYPPVTPDEEDSHQEDDSKLNQFAITRWADIVSNTFWLGEVLMTAAAILGSTLVTNTGIFVFTHVPGLVDIFVLLRSFQFSLFVWQAEPDFLNLISVLWTT